MHGQMRTTGRHRARWWCYDITVTDPTGTWHWRESDPAEAIAKASAQIFTPVVDNVFARDDAIAHLHSGKTLRVVCVDGTVIAVTPILM